MSTPPKRISCRSCESRKTATVGHLRFVTGNVHRTFGFTVIPFEDPALSQGELTSRLYHAIAKPLTDLIDKFRLSSSFELEMCFHTGSMGKRFTVRNPSNGSSGISWSIADFKHLCPTWRNIFSGGVIAVFATVQLGYIPARCRASLLSASNHRFKPRLAKAFLLRSEVEQNGVGHFVPLSFAYESALRIGPVFYKTVDGEHFCFEHPLKLLWLTEKYSPMKSLMPTAASVFGK